MSEKERKILLLFENIEQGSKAAFNELFMLYHQKLLSLARQYIKSNEGAEEITSELFVKLWLKRHNLSQVINPEVYLFISIKNACLNLIRSEKKRNSIFSPFSSAEESLDQEISSMADGELFKLLDKAIAALPEQRRVIFILIKEDGLKTKAVAEIMGISVRTVENHLYKAVRSLADTLSFYLGYHPQNKKRRSVASQLLLSFFF
ncbi:MAG: RNA polymerase sigma-70 factor [Chryseobacterium sp.]|nr:MAG: RNA polymerase sigma-70 factor [Chryseobacterium sp.]